MPTINQLVRKNRKDKVRKSKAPVLGVGLNTIKKNFILIYVARSHNEETRRIFESGSE